MRRINERAAPWSISVAPSGSGASTSVPDAIFGDLDGVVVIPREIEAEVFEGAWSKAHGEKRVFEAIKGGMSAQEAWDRYGILGFRRSSPPEARKPLLF